MPTVAGAKPVLLLRKDFSSCESVRRRVAEQTKLLRKNKRKIEVLKARFVQRSNQGEMTEGELVGEMR